MVEKRIWRVPVENKLPLTRIRKDCKSVCFSPGEPFHKRATGIVGEYPLESEHYFREKGAKAEKVIHDLSEKTFFTDWCYPNPPRPGGKELCDLLCRIRRHGVSSGRSKTSR